MKLTENSQRCPICDSCVAHQYRGSVYTGSRCVNDNCKLCKIKDAKKKS